MIIQRICAAWGMIVFAALACGVMPAAAADTDNEIIADTPTPREQLYAEAVALWENATCNEAAPVLMRLRAANPDDIIGREATRLLAICARTGIWRRGASLLLGYDSDLAGTGGVQTITPEDGSTLHLLIASLRAANPENADAIPDAITFGTKAAPGAWAGARGVLHRRRHAGGGSFGEIRLTGDARMAGRQGHGRIGAGIDLRRRTHHGNGRETHHGLGLATRYTGRGNVLGDVHSHSLALERQMYFPAPRSFTWSAGGRISLAETRGQGRLRLGRGEVILGLVHAAAPPSSGLGGKGLGSRFEIALGTTEGHGGSGDASVRRGGIAFGPLVFGDAAAPATLGFGAVAERLEYETPRIWSRNPPTEKRYGVHALLTYPLGEGLPLRVILRMTEREGDALPDSARNFSLEAEFPF